MTILLQIAIQEIALDDYRSFAVALDENRIRWELRGYGDTPGQAADDAYRKYRCSSEDWDLYGIKT